MNKSEDIGELGLALSCAQAEILDAYKDKKGYGYHYADLSQVLEITRRTLSKHKMSFTQLCGSADEKVTVETVLMHASGQWISSTIEMAVEKGKGMSMAQAVGSVITYARRYGLTAIVGITQSDNDASMVIEAPHTNPSSGRERAARDVYAEFESYAMAAGRTQEQIDKWVALNKVTELRQVPEHAVLRKIDDLKKQASH